MPTSATETLYSTLVVTSPRMPVAITATCALSLRKSRATNRQSHDTSISAGATSASINAVGTPAAPAVSSAMNALLAGARVTFRPPGRECTTRSTTLTSDACDATSGARPPAGPASKPYVTAPHGEREPVGVAEPLRVLVVVCEAVELGEPVPVALDEPVPVALLEPVPVADDEGVPVRVDAADDVAVSLGVSGATHARTFLTCRRLTPR